MLAYDTTRLPFRFVVFFPLMSEKLTFRCFILQGMSCGGCAASVKRILESQVSSFHLLLVAGFFQLLACKTLVTVSIASLEQVEIF